MLSSLLLSCLLAAPMPALPTVSATPDAAGVQLAIQRLGERTGGALSGFDNMGASRLRKLHLVRPDLIPYPLAYDVYC